MSATWMPRDCITGSARAPDTVAPAEATTMGGAAAGTGVAAGRCAGLAGRAGASAGLEEPPSRFEKKELTPPDERFGSPLPAGAGAAPWVAGGAIGVAACVAAPLQETSPGSDEDS